MIFKSKFYDEGDIETSKHFAWYPVRLNNEEIVWLQNYWVLRERTFSVDEWGWKVLKMWCVK